MRRQRIQPEMVSENGIAHGYVACYAFVEAAGCENTIGCCEVLFAVEAFFLEGFEDGVFPYVEGCAGGCAAHRGDGLVDGGFGMVDAESCCYRGLVWFGIGCEGSAWCLVEGWADQI